MATFKLPVIHVERRNGRYPFTATFDDYYYDGENPDIHGEGADEQSAIVALIEAADDEERFDRYKVATSSTERAVIGWRSRLTGTSGQGTLTLSLKEAQDACASMNAQYYAAGLEHFPVVVA